MSTEENREKRLNIARSKRAPIDKFMNKFVNHYNDKIYLKFRELGISYVPFRIEYNVWTTKFKSNAWRGVRSIHLVVDEKFIKSYFDKKISFESWLSSNYPEVSKLHYFHLSGRNVNDHPRINYYKKLFNREFSEKDRQPKLWGKEAPKILIGHIQEKEDSSPDSYRIFKPFTGVELDRFMENEHYIFNQRGTGKHSDMSALMSVHEDTDKIIDKVLKKVLGEFNKAFLNLELTGILDNKEKWDKLVDNKRYKTFDKFKQNNKWLSEIPEIESQWKITPKFPHIKNIKTWFMKTGIKKSWKFDEFQNMKTVKQRKNFIDSSVFLIANGIYAKKTGKFGGKTYSITGDAYSNTPFRKYHETAGAKIRASTMRRRGNVTQRADRRAKKYENWNKEIEREARGYRNSGNRYSRIRRSRGNTRKPSRSFDT
jgi:hypothetical protein